ncbi:RNA-directed DNA polymerase from mobile element jockey [Trichonephila clavipes]|nr:RNA-directed DNA polymerase from mobile element jockey [Trichonephila clavipes]
MNGLSTYAMKVKLDQFLELADTHNAQIIAIQETKIKEQMKLNIKEFHINCLDRPNRRGGGLALLIRDAKYQNIIIPQTSTDLEIQGVSIFWGKHKFNIFNMYLPPNQGCLPDSFLDLATANVSSIFIGDLNAKHTSWGRSVNNSRGCDILNAADDSALIFLNDGSPTHHFFSYNTVEALNIALASADVFPFCRWSVLGNIGKKDFSPLPLSHQLNVNWLNFKAVVIRNAKKTIPGGNFKSFKATYLHNDSCLSVLVVKRDRLFQNLKYTNRDSIRVEFNKTNAEIKRLYAAKMRASWHEICSKIDARTNNSKLWSIAKSLSRDDLKWRSTIPF